VSNHAAVSLRQQLESLIVVRRLATFVVERQHFGWVTEKKLFQCKTVIK
jgi:hypothetical protein